MSWPITLPKPPKPLTRTMRLTLELLRITHANRSPLNDAPRWSCIANPTAKDWKQPRVGTLHALCRRGLAQWIRTDDESGFWRISARGREFTRKY